MGVSHPEEMSPVTFGGKDEMDEINSPEDMAKFMAMMLTGQGSNVKVVSITDERRSSMDVIVIQEIDNGYIVDTLSEANGPRPITRHAFAKAASAAKHVKHVKALLLADEASPAATDEPAESQAPEAEANAPDAADKPVS